MLGLMMLANAGPMLLLSLFGGVIADRMQKKIILLLGQAASAGVALSVAIAMVVGTISVERGTGVGFLIATSAVHGLVMGFMMPSRQAIIPELVGTRRLMNAVALNAAGMNINRLAAPGAAGLLIALFGVQTVYFAMTGMYVIAIALITMLPSTSIASGRRGAWADFVEGLRYVKSNHLVLALLTLTMLSVSLSMPIMPLMPAIAQRHPDSCAGQLRFGLPSLPLIGGLLNSLPQLLTESSFRLGMLMSISGVGSLVGSLLVASMRSRNRGAIFLWSTPSLGLVLALYAFTSSFELALLISIGIGLGQSARMALSNGLVQYNVDDEHRGRVMSFLHDGDRSEQRCCVRRSRAGGDHRHSMGGGRLCFAALACDPCLLRIHPFGTPFAMSRALHNPKSLPPASGGRLGWGAKSGEKVLQRSPMSRGKNQ